MEFSQKTEARPTYVSTIPLVAIYPKEYKSIYKRDTFIPMLIVTLFTIELTKVPNNR
jgi:hypothetical protein